MPCHSALAQLGVERTEKAHQPLDPSAQRFGWCCAVLCRCRTRRRTSAASCETCPTRTERKHHIYTTPVPFYSVYMWLSALALPARLTSCLCLCVCRTRLEEASTAFQYFVNPTLAAQVHACTLHHIITSLHLTHHHTPLP
jgi:hypothetical protein